MLLEGAHKVEFSLKVARRRPVFNGGTTWTREWFTRREISAGEVTWSWKVLRATITVHAISQAVQFPVRPSTGTGHSSPGDHNLICTPVTCLGKECNLDLNFISLHYRMINNVDQRHHPPV